MRTYVCDICQRAVKENYLVILEIQVEIHGHKIVEICRDCKKELDVVIVAPDWATIRIEQLDKETEAMTKKITEMLAKG